MPIPRAFISKKLLRHASEHGEVIRLNPDEARTLRERIPLADTTLKNHKKAIHREIGERRKRLAIILSEIDRALAVGGVVELPASFYTLAVAPEDGL